MRDERSSARQRRASAPRVDPVVRAAERAAAIAALPAVEQLDAAREIALRMLTATARTRYQISDGLVRRGFDPEVISQLLDRFAEVGLVDDAAYANVLVRTRRDERGLSRRAIAAELTRKGIHADTVAEALEQYDDEAETALREAMARLRRTRGIEPQVRQRRAFAALARKGYGSSVAWQAVQQALAAEDDDVTENPSQLGDDG